MESQARLYPSSAINDYRHAIERVWQTYVTDSRATVSRLRPDLGWLELVCGLVGVIIVAIYIYRVGLDTPVALAGICLIGQAVTSIFGIKVYWPRYHLFVVLVTSIGIGVVAQVAWSGLISFNHRTGSGLTLSWYNRRRHDGRVQPPIQKGSTPG